jgi:hypothetical protein
MKTIRWWISLGPQTETGEFEVDAPFISDYEISEIARQEAFNVIKWGFEVAEDE